MTLSLLQDHAQYPRRRRKILDMEIVGHAANPMCADTFDVGIRVEQGIIVEAAFAGSGCALAVGSASLLCEYVVGKRVIDLAIEEFMHLGDEQVGRMREGCVKVSVTALCRALNLSR